MAVLERSYLGFDSGFVPFTSNCATSTPCLLALAVKTGANLPAERRKQVLNPARFDDTASWFSSDLSNWGYSIVKLNNAPDSQVRMAV
jgi:hypothetical protein